MKTYQQRYFLFLKIRDIISVSRGLWFLMLLFLGAFFAFFIAPQGTDLLLAILEDCGTLSLDISTGACLIFAVIVWSISSEFSVRMLIYLSDNSGKALSPERVNFRINIQKKIIKSALLYPICLIAACFAKAFISNYEDLKLANELKTIGKGLAIVCLFHLLAFGLLYFLYFKRGIKKISEKVYWLSWLTPSASELSWANKLYGIFNDIRIDMPLSLHWPDSTDLPRDEILPNSIRIPKSNYIIPYANNPQKPDLETKTWMFKVRIWFYQNIIIQLIVFSSLAIFLIVLFGGFLPPSVSVAIGSMGIFCLAFGCWQLIYVLTFFIDKAQKVFPLRLVLLIILVTSSVFNNDHPVRKVTSIYSKDLRPTVEQHFKQWLSNLKNDPAYKQSKNFRPDSTPVIFIAAEGGALRTGAFSAMMLSALQDKFPDFSKYVYCYSGVSGGALGANFFNAEMMANTSKEKRPDHAETTKQFFSKDYLAPLTAKLAFGEIINCFWPRHISKFDRAIALEKAWEYAMDEIGQHKAFNPLASSFEKTISNTQPATLINTVCVETGSQCVWSNVKLSSLPYASERDLFSLSGSNLAYSTAINLSSRFPFVSPSARFDFNHTSRHYVDGGYYENQGAETLLQVLKVILKADAKIKPTVIQFNFGPTQDIKPNKMFNEISDVVEAIYNTRSGRGRIQNLEIKKFINEKHGEFIEIALKSNIKKVPMDWVLSNTAVSRIANEIRDVVNIKGGADRSDKTDLARLFLYH